MMAATQQTAAIVHCNLESQQAIHQSISKLVGLIHEYRWIIDAYVSDFYTAEHWSRLPREVQTYFDASQPPELAWMLSPQMSESDTVCPSKRIVPLSLLALQCCIQAYSLKRIAVEVESTETWRDIRSALLGTKSSDAHLETSQCKMPSVKSVPFQTPRYKNGQCMDMQHIFRKHVKPKKQHEIQKLGQTISRLSELADCQTVVDVGAGLGHLSRLLSFQHGLQVTTVEAADGHAPKALAFDREMKKDVLKKIKLEKKLLNEGNSFPDNSSLNETKSTDKSVAALKGLSDRLNMSQLQTAQIANEATKQNDPLEDESLPNHVVCTIQPDIATSQFLDIIARTQDNEDRGEEGTQGSFVLAGLHACGDLTPTLLRVFVECPSAGALASVACCYMKMSALSDDVNGSVTEGAQLSNYPMSEFLRSRRQITTSLSYEAREMACHFADAYRDRLKSDSQHLKIHSYRAALQYLLVHVRPDFQSGQTRFVSKKGTPPSFTQYAAENVKKADIELNTVPQALLEQCEGMTRRWHRVMAFYTLRLSLAPAVETLILLDRMLFLLEHGIPSVLVPIFDSNISPRNFALLALKHTDR